MPELSDLEITKLCAEAMGYSVSVDMQGVVFFTTDGRKQSFRHDYAPLTNDAQCLALVKRIGISIEWTVSGWDVCGPTAPGVNALDLNRAICAYVAIMQQQRSEKT